MRESRITRCTRKSLRGLIECFNDLLHNGLCMRSAVSFHSFGICTKVSSGEATVVWVDLDWVQLLDRQVIKVQIEMIGKWSLIIVVIDNIYLLTYWVKIYFWIINAKYWGSKPNMLLATFSGLSVIFYCGLGNKRDSGNQIEIMVPHLFLVHWP